MSDPLAADETAVSTEEATLQADIAKLEADIGAGAPAVAPSQALLDAVNTLANELAPLEQAVNALAAINTNNVQVALNALQALLKPPA